MADAYVVVFAALMLPAGLLGDRFGRRLMLITGSGIFLAGSVIGALAGDVNAVVVARLDVTGLPARAADTAGDSVVAAHLVADQAGSAHLAASANSAYVHGMGLTLLVSACAALVAALPAAAFLPGAAAARRTESADSDMVTPKADARQ